MTAVPTLPSSSSTLDNLPWSNERPEYCYPPDFTILRNKLNIRDLPTLEAAERQFVVQRLLEAMPKGDFDLEHLRAIHRHLFQDVYEWAGNVRTVEISKGSSQFLPRSFIETGMVDVHRRIVAANYFQGDEPGPVRYKRGVDPGGCESCSSLSRG